VAFSNGGSAEKQAVVGEKEVGQSRAFLAYGDTSDLARDSSLLE